MTVEVPEFVEVGEGVNARRIAVRRRAGAGPTVVWLGGFRSDMLATKASALDDAAKASGGAFLRFDYGGHGESGGRFEDFCISTWLEDALAVISRFGGERPVLVGSSMGGWIALLVARELARQGRAPDIQKPDIQKPDLQKPGAMVLIAPAVDFTEKLMWAAMPEDARAALTRDGVWMRPSEYSDEPYPITRQLMDDGVRHNLLEGPIDPGCPVHILQGMQDPDVPWTHARRVFEALPGASVNLTYIKDGDHRLSRPEDIALLVRVVEAMRTKA